MHLGWARKTVTVLALAAALTAVGVSAEAQSNSAVSGVVKDASGQPVAGAYVRVRSADMGFTFMVVSQEQGRYRTPNLLPGS